MVKQLSFGPATNQLPSCSYILRLVPNTCGFCEIFIDSSERYSLTGCILNLVIGVRTSTLVSWIANFSLSYVDQSEIFDSNLTRDVAGPHVDIRWDFVHMWESHDIDDMRHHVRITWHVTWDIMWGPHDMWHEESQDAMIQTLQDVSRVSDHLTHQVRFSCNLIRLWIQLALSS